MTSLFIPFPLLASTSKNRRLAHPKFIRGPVSPDCNPSPVVVSPNFCIAPSHHHRPHCCPAGPPAEDHPTTALSKRSILPRAKEQQSFRARYPRCLWAFHFSHSSRLTCCSRLQTVCPVRSGWFYLFSNQPVRGVPSSVFFFPWKRDLEEGAGGLSCWWCFCLCGKPPTATTTPNWKLLLCCFVRLKERTFLLGKDISLLNLQYLFEMLLPVGWRARTLIWVRKREEWLGPLYRKVFGLGWPKCWKLIKLIDLT